MRRRFFFLIVLAVAAATGTTSWGQPAPGRPSAQGQPPAPASGLRFGLPPVSPSPAPAPAVTPPADAAPLPAPGATLPAADPPRAQDEPSVLIDLFEAPKEIHIGQPFTVEITVTTRPGVQVNLPAKIDPGPRFTLEGDPSEVTSVTFDSGNIMRKFRLRLVSWTTDRLLNRRADRVRDRMLRHEQDLAEQKTKLTEARLANQDTKAIEALIEKYQARVDADSAELAGVEAEYELRPIPVTYRRADGTIGVVQSHEVGRGPRILISSRLANEPDPKLKEPASEENVKAGGPFWEPWELYEENTTLKNVLLGVLIGLAVMALLVPLFLWLRKRWRRAPPPAPPRPAHVLAFERLEALRARGIPAETPEAQAFAFELAEILREYFGNRYHFYSLEMTTTELLAQLGQVAPAGLTPAELEEFFEFLDLVKFAKAPLEPAEAGTRLEAGVDFVRKTLVVQLEPLPGEPTPSEALPPDVPTSPSTESVADGPEPVSDGPEPVSDGPEPVKSPPRDRWEPPVEETMDEQHRRLLLESRREREPRIPPGGDHEAS